MGRSRVERIARTDLTVFELDPAPDVASDRFFLAAKTRCERVLGLRRFATTTGGEGRHVATPMQPRACWDEVKAFSKTVAEALARFDTTR